jgi:hypothetical protein
MTELDHWREAGSVFDRGIEPYDWKSREKCLDRSSFLKLREGGRHVH